MRINKFVALATGISRRAADTAIIEQHVHIDGRVAQLGQEVDETDRVTLDGRRIVLPAKTVTIMINKPVGYVCSRAGQGSKTIYDLLPKEQHSLKPVGRLDKDSSGLLLMTSDGELANQLTHPSFQKDKVYEVRLNKPLEPIDKQKIEAGIMLEDGLSSLELNKSKTSKLEANTYIVQMHEGRNRQIRRTFAALHYKVIKLQRIQFGEYKLGTLHSGSYQIL